MTTRVTEEEKRQVLEVLDRQIGSGSWSAREAAVRMKLEIEVAEAQNRAAVAGERAALATETAAKASVKNAQYMLWSVIVAAAAAVFSLASAIVAGFHWNAPH
jgi:hypothetical protein